MLWIKKHVNCLAIAKLVSLYARRFGKGQWSFVGLGSEKVVPKVKIVHKESGTIFAESTCPIFRATTPLSRGQLESRGHGKLSIHFATV